VRERYPKAVISYRGRSARAETDRRLRQFREALEQAGFGARTEDEAIVHLIPKRNVETWVLCLSGRRVDENTDYSKEGGIDELIKPAAITFFSWSRPNATPPAPCVPSLLAAIPEVRRLE
jgi:hypothetical protein